MKTNSKFLIIPMMFVLLAMGIPQELKQMNYLAYLKSDKSAWKNNVAFAMKLYQDQPSPDSEFQLAFTEYGLLNVSMVDMDKKLFESYVDECESRLEKLADGKKYGAEAKALLSGLYGFKIAHSPLKAMMLGGKSSNLLEQAMKQNPESSIVLKMYASNQYFTPEIWGGDKELALKAFEKSTQKLMGTDLEKSWIHLDNLAWTGILQNEMGDQVRAKATWEKALTIEPDFYWVSKNLLPSLN
jgi:tetratricopeptide (TPR) repeat protein